MKPILVLDANIALVWGLGEEEAVEKTKTAREALQQGVAIVPSIWSYEVTNAIIVKERTGRITQDVVEKSLSLLADLPVQVKPLTHADVLQTVVPLARKHRLTSYDASYLALAISDELPLATLDRNLMHAARSEGVAILAS